MGLSARHLALLSAWFSPACPVGAFSYSHGLETLVSENAVADAACAQDAIEAALTLGGGRDDLILAACTHRGEDVDALALALPPTQERYDETVMQGTAFARVVDAVWPLGVPLGGGPIAYPVAVGRAARGHGLPLAPLLLAMGHAFVANLVSAAVRLVPLGQTDGQRITAALAPAVARVAQEASSAGVDDIGSAALGLDLASMAHEVLHVRLFRS